MTQALLWQSDCQSASSTSSECRSLCMRRTACVLHCRRRRLGVQAYTHPYGFSRNSRHYEPDSIGFDEDMYEQATAAAFTEDVTFLFAGLPALQELEMGCYTDVGRGEEALSRKLRCGPVAGVAAPHGAASGAAARAGRVRGLGLGLGRPPAAAAGAPAQRLTALKVVNALDIDGIQNMLLPSECWSKTAGNMGKR